MRKLFYIFYVLFFSSISGFSQEINDWINYNQTYVKFKVAEDGIYRINRNTLVAINNSFLTVNPKNLQVFVRGQEQPIYVHGEDDFSFDQSDYIELFCQKNDGFLDSLMYDNPSEQNNPYFSQINDSISYFITWENSPNQKKRFVTYSSSDYSSYTEINSVIQKTLVNYTNSFYWGQRVSNYSSGKGWFDSNNFSYQSPVNKAFDISDRVPNSDVKVNFSVCGVPNSDVLSNLNHHLKIHYNSNEMFDASYTGYQGVKDNFIIPFSDISSNDLLLSFSSNYNQNGQVDRNAIAYILLEYSKNLDFSNSSYASFYVPSSVQNRSLSLENFSGTNSILYNIENSERTELIPSSSNQMAILHPNAEENHLLISSNESLKIVSQVANVSFVDYKNLSESPELLMIYQSILEPSVNEYAAYRRQQGYKVLTAEISDLYNQFAYGIDKHPLAIRNFVDFIDRKYGQANFLFLIGKSISSSNIRNTPIAFNKCLVPTMGNPPSDVLLTSNLDGLGLQPSIATGRIAARSSSELTYYLDKVKDYESTPNALWKKKAIHFGGGSNSYEQTTFKNYLKEYELIYEDTLIGGQVTTFLKDNSDPIQISVSDSVALLINSGVSQMTFFGHGSTSGFDQNIDGPENYNNMGKYPLIEANSCLSGDIHQNTSFRTISEQWVLIQNKGAIGFLAASDLGYASQLHQLSKQFYKSLSYKKYGSSIGEVIKEGLKNYASNQTNNVFIRKTVYDNTFHGDPVVIINAFDKPDLQITNSGVSFNPEPITSDVDSFALNIEYYNVGRAFVDSFLISIEREYPNGAVDFQTIHRPACMFNDQVQVKLPTDIVNGVGMNKIIIRLDYLNQINELSENNNEVQLSFLIQSNDLIPIYPYEFAVVPNSNITLVASSGNPFEEQFTAVFQIDTIDSFDSPAVVSEDIISDGGITEWALPFTLSDSTVYFWRVSLQGSNRWKSSSFRYIQGQRGWSQAHHFQFEKDEYQFINYKKSQRKFEYITTPKTLLCTNIGSVSVSRVQEVGYWVDGVGDQNSCGAVSSFNVVILDSLNLEAWHSDRGDYGQRDYPQCSSRSRPDYYFQFSTGDSVAMEQMANFLNSIPSGFHILIYSIWNGNFTNLPENTKQAFEQLYPASQIRNIADNIPYIFYIKKGDISTGIERIGSNTSDEINLTVSLPTNYDNGNIYSTLIGPALEWKSFHWKYKNNIDDKETELKILATDSQGHQIELINGLNKDSLNILDLSSRINASVYPYLQLEIYSKDSIQKIPTQIKSWSLLYQDVPETAIEPSEGYFFLKDTVQQGENIEFSISTKNISPYDMDSLKVSYFVKDNQNNISLIQTKKLKPHPSQDVITDTISFNTANSHEKNSIWVEFNSVDSLTGEYNQLEQYHFNNIAVRYFYVESDKVNPLLNVTFDGLHIMDGDVVSPNPEILIRIKDENKYLAMQDPNLVSVYLKFPYSDDEIKVEINDSLNNQQLFWTASSLPDNVAEMLFSPKNLKDGIYTLRVGATDASANESGKYDYKINFEVVNKSTITQILNYPNPFSSSTQFVFTLTGSEVPEQILIQIMTISGKVVKEIDLSSVSDVHIGRNITDYKWNGRDQYGDLLANGVYFYKVYVRNNGTEVEKSSTDADPFFKQGIGKMYIIR